MAPNLRSGEAKGGNGSRKGAHKNTASAKDKAPPKKGPKRSAPEKAPKKSAKQVEQERAAASERKGFENAEKKRLADRRARQKKKKDHIKEGKMNTAQRRSATIIANSISNIVKEFDKDPELYANIKSEMTPYFDTLRTLALARPDRYRPVAMALYEENWAETGDTDGEDSPPPPRAAAGNRKKGPPKIMDSDEEEESGREQQVEEEAKNGRKKKDKGKEATSASEPLFDDESLSNNKVAEKPKKHRESNTDHDPSSGKKRKRSLTGDNDGDKDDGPVSKRTRSSASPPPGGNKDVKPKKPEVPFTKARGLFQQTRCRV